MLLKKAAIGAVALGATVLPHDLYSQYPLSDSVASTSVADDIPQSGPRDILGEPEIVAEKPRTEPDPAPEPSPEPAAEDSDQRTLLYRPDIDKTGKMRVPLPADEDPTMVKPNVAVSPVSEAAKLVYGLHQETQRSLRQNPTFSLPAGLKSKINTEFARTIAKARASGAECGMVSVGVAPQSRNIRTFSYVSLLVGFPKDKGMESSLLVSRFYHASHYQLEQKNHGSIIKSIPAVLEVHRDLLGKGQSLSVRFLPPEDPSACQAPAISAPGRI